MIPFFEVGVDPRFAGHVSIVDCRALESVDTLALSTLLAYLTRRRHAWGANVDRQAVLHPDGFVGAVVAGALHVIRPPYPFACFQGDGADAFAWGGVPELWGAVEALRAQRLARSPITQSVRAVLEAYGLVGVAEVARALGVSQRTLQRRLGQAGTSFREERERYLDLEIEKLLAGTELDLEAIAAHVGLSSASNLVAHFRATHGTTPGAWRSHRRAARAR